MAGKTRNCKACLFSLIAIHNSKLQSVCRPRIAVSIGNGLPFWQCALAARPEVVGWGARRYLGGVSDSNSASRGCPSRNPVLSDPLTLTVSRGLGVRTRVNTTSVSCP